MSGVALGTVSARRGRLETRGGLDGNEQNPSGNTDGADVNYEEKSPRIAISPALGGAACSQRIKIAHHGFDNVQRINGLQHGVSPSSFSASRHSVTFLAPNDRS
jgi:hypothetical protein